MASVGVKATRDDFRVVFCILICPLGIHLCMEGTSISLTWRDVCGM